MSELRDRYVEPPPQDGTICIFQIVHGLLFTNVFVKWGSEWQGWLYLAGVPDDWRLLPHGYVWQWWAPADWDELHEWGLA